MLTAMASAAPSGCPRRAQATGEGSQERRAGDGRELESTRTWWLLMLSTHDLASIAVYG